MNVEREVHDERRRVYELDLLRLLAAIAVLLYHYTFRLHAKDGYSPVAFPDALGSVTRYGFLGVQLFFFISGAVILRSAVGRPARAFVAARFARLFPAYWAMVTITFLARRFWGFGPVAATSPTNYLGNLTMAQGFYGGDLVDGVYWTLARELVFYAIVWAVLATGQFRHIRLVLTGWLLSSLTLELLHPTTDVRRWLATDYAPFFVGGAAVAMLASTDRRREVLRNWALAGASLAVAIWQTEGREARKINATFRAGTVNGIWMALIVTICFVVVWTAYTGRLRRLGQPWMAVAGALTYPLYLVHQNVGAIMFTKLSSWNRWVLLAFIAITMVGLSWLVHTLIERPLTPILRGVTTRSLACITRRRSNRSYPPPDALRGERLE